MLVDMYEISGILPEALAKRPELAAPLQWYLRAFYDCSRGRAITMGGAGPIPVSEVLAYVQLADITDLDERAWFLQMMLRMDGAYLGHQAKRQALKS